MDLLEYQAKKLFRQIGIPVLPSETIAEPRELKQLQIPYPVVLKSQVRVGGRGKAGGVKFVTNTIDAIAAARTIFNLSILGEYPEVILAEAHYNAEKELFLGIVLDYQLQRPVIFGSPCGGMDVDLLMKNLQQVVIETEFSPFLARRLTSQMGLSGELLLGVSEIIEKMYELFRTKDLDLIEINPLGVNAAGNLMALDGKITISDHALKKHPELVTLNPIESARESNISQSSSLSFATTEKISSNEPFTEIAVRWLDWQDPKGKIAILANDDDLALLCWDIIRQKKEKPACAIVLDGYSAQKQLLDGQLQQICSQLQLLKGIKVLLINFWGTEEMNLAIAKAFFELFEPASQTVSPGMGEERAITPINGSKGRLRRSQSEDLTAKSEPKIVDLPPLKFVIRLATPDIERYQQEFAHEAILWTNNLEDGIAQAISLSKAK